MTHIDDTLVLKDNFRTGDKNNKNKEGDKEQLDEMLSKNTSNKVWVDDTINLRRRFSDSDHKDTLESLYDDVEILKIAYKHHGIRLKELDDRIDKASNLINKFKHILESMPTDHTEKHETMDEFLVHSPTPIIHINDHNALASIRSYFKEFVNAIVKGIGAIVLSAFVYGVAYYIHKETKVIFNEPVETEEFKKFKKIYDEKSNGIKNKESSEENKGDTK